MVVGEALILSRVLAGLGSTGAGTVKGALFHTGREEGQVWEPLYS